MDFLELLYLLTWTWEGPLWLFERVGNAVVLFLIGLVCVGVGIFGLFVGYSIGIEIGCGVLAVLAFWAAYRERQLEHPIINRGRRKR